MLVIFPLYLMGAIAGGYFAWKGQAYDRSGPYGGDFVDYFVTGVISVFAGLTWPVWLPFYGIFKLWRQRQNASS